MFALGAWLLAMTTLLSPAAPGTASATTASAPVATGARPAADAATTDYAAGVAARDTGDYAGAASKFAAAVLDGGPLAPMARLRQGQMLVAARQGLAAAPVLAAVLAENALPPSLAQIAIREAASNLHELSRDLEAVSVLAGMAALDGVPASARADARWQIASLRRAAGDPSWLEDARSALASSNTFGGAAAALDAVEAAGATVPPMTAALVDYRAFRDTRAEQRFNRVIADGSTPAPDRAAAWFYIGALRERANDPAGALTAYALSASINSAGPVADDAFYWRAHIYQDRGDLASEIAEFDHLARDYPDSNFAREARITPAVELGRAGRTSEALPRLEAIATTARSDEAATAARWHQVFRVGAGNTTAPALLASAYDAASFGSALEQSSADPQSPLPASAVLERPSLSVMTADEAFTVARWMSATFGPVPQTFAADASDPLRRLGFALIAGGDTSVGRTLLGAAIGARASRPYDLYDIAIVARDAGVYDIEVGAARALLAPLTGAQQLRAPRSILQLAYPLPYLEAMLAGTQEANMPPLLMYALVRQESAFNPNAGSPAGAYGLSQFISGTAQAVMQELNITGIPVAQAMVDPALSLRMGARYLADETRAFNGNTVAALAAYNAGGGNARRWLDAQAPSNTDGYRWTVSYAETRAYLDTVLTNYAWYRYVYAGAPFAIR